MNSSSSFHPLILAVAVIFLRCPHPTSAATCHPDDEAGLLAFKSGITQDPSGLLSSWKKGTHCCSSWHGVECMGPRVTSLFINGNTGADKEPFLSGTISPSLAKLQNLEQFQLRSFKNITGSFPQFFFRLPELRYIDISNNGLSGPLPANGTLSKVEMFFLDGNRFTGPIPSSLFKSPWLDYLVLGGNLLTRTIPLEFSSLKKMFYMDLSGNHLSGTIPYIFKSMSSLHTLSLSNNNFNGELPPSFASLSQTLTSLNLSHNNLSGLIPNCLSRFVSLAEMDLSWNQFSGTMQTSNLSTLDLYRINLPHNLLSGPLPYLNMRKIVADLSYNKFQMKLNDWNAKYVLHYEYIDLSENQISGSPARFLKEKCPARVFKASGNKLRFDIGKLNFSTSLQTLDLSRNLIFGKVPPTDT